MTQGCEANQAFTMPPIDHARDLRAVVRNEAILTVSKQFDSLAG